MSLIIQRNTMFPASAAVGVQPARSRGNKPLTANALAKKNPPRDSVRRVNHRPSNN